MTNDYDDAISLPCGRDLPMPTIIFSHTLPLVYNIMLLVLSSMLTIVLLCMVRQAYKLRNMGSQDHRLVCNGHLV
jgi:hypothetical protein